MAKTEEIGWLNVVVRVGLNACTHPIEYAKILMQVSLFSLFNIYLLYGLYCLKYFYIL